MENMNFAELLVTLRLYKRKHENDIHAINIDSIGSRVLMSPDALIETKQECGGDVSIERIHNAHWVYVKAKDIDFISIFDEFEDAAKLYKELIQEDNK